ncbi:L-rhamnose-binding lectin CSL2-like [Symphorus nematophorus]
MLTTAETTVTCDPQDFAQTLNCDSGVIVVQNVEACHREKEACVDGVPPALVEPPLCSSTSVLNIVKKRCNGRYRCMIRMDSCHSAKPCLTRCVWMKTTFTCEAGRSQVIKVLMANYGRLRKRVCRYQYPRTQPPNTSCRLPSTLKKMADRCDGKNTCSVRASNQIFSNPCAGTRKYLKFSYTCVDPGEAEERESVCERVGGFCAVGGTCKSQYVYIMFSYMFPICWNRAGVRMSLA